MRIVSLLPSATELICALGLEDALVGVTHECDFPPSALTLPKVTNTLIPKDATSSVIDQLVRDRLGDSHALYTLNMPVLKRLRPDLIVTQALCDVCAVAETEVSAASCSLPGNPPVVNLEPRSLADVFSTLRLLGEATDTSERADAVVADLTARVDAVVKRAESSPSHPRVALLEWIDPPFSCGHWSPELVRLAGGTEVLGVEGEPSRTLDWEEIVASRPEIVFIACCGFSIERTREDFAIFTKVSGWQDIPAVRSGRVYVVDGSHYFSRPGPRLVDSLEMLAHAINPDLHPLPPNVPAPIKVDPAA